MKNLCTVSQLRDKEISRILNLADQLKYEKENHVSHPLLAGKTLGVIPVHSASRTRVCLEVGMYDLGGQTVALPGDGLEEGTQKITAAAQVFSRFVDGIALRTPSQNAMEIFAQNCAVPFLSAATAEADPCQALADLMTIRERRGSFAGQKLAYIGPVCGAASSLIAGALCMGMEVTICISGKADKEPAGAIGFVSPEGQLVVTDNPAEAAADADVLCTAPGSAVKIDAALTSLAKEDVLVLHEQPAHIGEELDAAEFQAHAAEIYDQAENKLHVIKAVLVNLLNQDS